MRKDMKEVLITKGRRGSQWARNEEVCKIRRTIVDEEDRGERLGMRPRSMHSWGDRKVDQLGEHLTPLYRYLRSRIGFKWDDTYSEIRANNPMDSAVGAHIYQHLWGYVEKDVVYVDDRPCDPVSRWWRGTPSYLRPGDLYIDRNGILAEVPRIPKESTPVRITVYNIDKTTYAVQNKKGIWFLFKYSNRMKKEEKVREHTHYKMKTDGSYEKDEDGKYVTFKTYEKYIQITPFFQTVYIDEKDFELLPKVHPPKYRYSDYSYQHTVDRMKASSEYYYVVSVKSMNTKEKQRLGIIGD